MSSSTAVMIGVDMTANMICALRDWLLTVHVDTTSTTRMILMTNAVGTQLWINRSAASKIVMESFLPTESSRSATST